MLAATPGPLRAWLLSGQAPPEAYGVSPRALAAWQASGNRPTVTTPASRETPAERQARDAARRARGEAYMARRFGTRDEAPEPQAKAPHALAEAIATAAKEEADEALYGLLTSFRQA